MNDDPHDDFYAHWHQTDQLPEGVGLSTYAVLFAVALVTGLIVYALWPGNEPECEAACRVQLETM